MKEMKVQKAPPSRRRHSSNSSSFQMLNQSHVLNILEESKLLRSNCIQLCEDSSAEANLDRVGKIKPCVCMHLDYYAFLHVVPSDGEDLSCLDGRSTLLRGLQA